MFNIAEHEILIFLRQAGLATAGAASLWGLVFLVKYYRERRGESEQLKEAAHRLLYLFFPAILVYALSYTALEFSACVFCASAHEGISRAETIEEIAIQIQNQFPLFILLFLFCSFSFLYLIHNRRFSAKNLSILYGGSLFAITILMAYPWIDYGSFRVYISAALHNWHSVLTLGSVITVDFLYFVMRKSSHNFLGWAFTYITKRIWIGLGLDFLSAGLVFHEEFEPSDRTLFMQTLIGILIINGAILSGPFARRMLSNSFLKSVKAKVGFNFYTLTGLSSSVSLASWISITALDGFRNISLLYWQFFALYILFVFILFAVHEELERVLSKSRRRREFICF